MTTKTKAPMREGVSKAKAPVRKGLAYLIEDAMAKSEAALTVEGIADKLNDMAIDLAELISKSVMPLQNQMTMAFGPDVWKSFYDTANQQVQQLIAAVQNTQLAINNEFQRLRQGVNGGDMSDMAMDAGAAGAAPGAPGMAEPGMDAAAPADGGLTVPTDDAGNAEDMAVGGNFAGRERKGAAAPMESRQPPRGKARKVNEVGAYSDDLMAPSTPMPEPQSHESDMLPFHIEGLNAFHPGMAQLAVNIRNMIRTEELSGAQRKGLGKVLAVMAANAQDPSRWAGIDADVYLNMLLRAERINPTASDAVAAVVTELKRLSHAFNLKHSKVLENNISMLRKAVNPDAVILKVFRSKLKENRDGQMAAIRTARTFAIDIEDVVAVVKEAAARRPKKIVEFKADINPAKKGMFKGNDVADLQKQKTALKKRSEAAQEDGGKVPAAVATKEREVNYAIRAKRGWKGGTKRTDEDDGNPALQQGVPIFPIEQSTTPTAGQQPMGSAMSQNGASTAPNAANAPATGGLSGQSGVAGNASPNMTGAPTNKPLTPGDKRAAQNQNLATQQSNNNSSNQGDNQQRTTSTVSQTGSTSLPFQPPGKAMKPSDLRQQRQPR